MMDPALSIVLVLLALVAGYSLGFTRRSQKSTTVTIPKGVSVIVRGEDGSEVDRRRKKQTRPTG